MNRTIRITFVALSFLAWSSALSVIVAANEGPMASEAPSGESEVPCLSRDLHLNHMVLNVSNALRKGSQYQEWILKREAFLSSIQEAFRDELVLECVTTFDLRKIYKALSTSFPQGPIPSPVPGSIGIAMPPATTRIGDSTVNGIVLDACQAYPTYFAGTTAFPQCAQIICYILGSPKEFQSEHEACTSNYNFGSYQYLYTWFYPTLSCVGQDCS